MKWEEMANTKDEAMEKIAPPMLPPMISGRNAREQAMFSYQRAHAVSTRIAQPDEYEYGKRQDGVIGYAARFR